MTVELVLYNNAKTALEAARNIDEVKDIRDRALAFQVYAVQSKDRELLEAAIEIKMRAERKAGQMLADMLARGERQGPGRPKDRKGREDATIKELADLGIKKWESSRWQMLSQLAMDDFKQRVATIQEETVKRVESTSEERSAEKKARRAGHERDLTAKIRALPNKRYGLILADPEWKFVPWSEETGSDRSAANHYATSALDAIKKRDVPSISADDCALALWATVPMLPQALEVMKAWGFDYRSHIVWLKNRISTGYWFRNTHELLLIGIKGNVPAPAPGTQWESAFDADVGEHSEKPELAYEMLEAYFPTLPKIELNAREKRDGWDVWGAEAPVDIEAAQ
jgi:N6-adenosine-specific RNA methylase IME4